MENNLAQRTSLYGFEMREHDPDRRFTNRDNSQDIKRLWQRQHEIIGMALQGFKHKDIAKALNIHPLTVSKTLNSELGEKKLSELREKRDEEYVEVSKEVSRLAEKALAIYEEIMDNPSGDLKLKKETADTVLMDLGGHRAPTKIDTRSSHISATLEEINEFKRLGLKAAKEAGMLVEIPNEGSFED